MYPQQQRFDNNVPNISSPLSQSGSRSFVQSSGINKSTYQSSRE